MNFVSFLLLASQATFPATAGGESYSLQEQIDGFALYTDCSPESGCAIHLETAVGGVPARSMALPLRSRSGETENFSSGEWYVGVEESSIRISVEPAGDGAVLVRQEAGFDHPTVAYSLLVPGPSNFHTVENWQSRNGPEELKVRSIGGLISIERHQGDSINSIEKWRLDSDRRELVPAQ